MRTVQTSVVVEAEGATRQASLPPDVRAELRRLLKDMLVADFLSDQTNDEEHQGDREEQA